VTLHEARKIMLSAVLMYVLERLVNENHLPESDPIRIAAETNIKLRQEIMDAAVEQYANLLKEAERAT